jgi:hypothetical protein
MYLRPVTADRELKETLRNRQVRSRSRYPQRALAQKYPHRLRAPSAALFETNALPTRALHGSCWKACAQAQAVQIIVLAIIMCALALRTHTEDRAQISVKKIALDAEICRNRKMARSRNSILRRVLVSGLKNRLHRVQVVAIGGRATMCIGSAFGGAAVFAPTLAIFSSRKSATIFLPKFR